MRAVQAWCIKIMAAISLSNLKPAIHDDHIMLKIFMLWMCPCTLLCQRMVIFEYEPHSRNLLSENRKVKLTTPEAQKIAFTIPCPTVDSLCRMQVI